MGADIMCMDGAAAFRTVVVIAFHFHEDWEKKREEKEKYIDFA